jgi:hypothetical protein
MYYKKVEIGSEADLPKERGNYFTHYKKSDSLGSEFINLTYDRTIGERYKGEHSTKDFWLKHVDWYLQPVLPSSIPTDELTKKLSHVIHNLTLIQWTDLEGEMTPKNSELIRQEIKQLELIEKTLQSIHPQSSKRDELIEVYKELTFVLNQLADYEINKDNTDKAFQLRLKISELTKELGKI